MATAAVARGCAIKAVGLRLDPRTSVAVRSTRYRSLDAWRGLACVAVLLLHSGVNLAGGRPSSPWSWLGAMLGFGWVGVPIFFVISGYCISATADASRRNGRHVREYFVRRVRRIFPPYLILLGLSAGFVGGLELAVSGLLSSQPHGIPRPWDVGVLNWVGSLTLTESWLGPLLGREQFFLTPAWTLCYEEQFYAVTGLLLILCRRKFFTGALVVTGLTGLARLTGLALPGFFLDGRWFSFAAGIGVFYAVNYATRGGKRGVGALLLAGVAYAALHPRLPGGAPGHYKELMAAFLFALVILAIHRWDRRLSDARLLAPLAFCGSICYSLYLVHWPVVKAITHGAVLLGVTGGPLTALVVVPVCCACSIAAAWAFHRAVERRFMNPTQHGAQSCNGD